MSVDEFAESICDPERRLEYVENLAVLCRGISPRHMHRAFWLAARVLSVEYDVALIILRRRLVGRRSPLEQYIGPLQKSSVGEVYFATCRARPGLLKVGFSQDPERRAKAISRIIGATVSIHRSIPGTMLDEHSLHCQWRDRQAFGEWFYTEAAA